MKLFFSVFVVLASLPTLALAANNFKCVGQDVDGRDVKVVWRDYANENQSAVADVQVTIAGSTKSYKGLDAYADSEGGFDYGVTGSDFMFLVVLPPNWIGKNKVGGQLYFGKSYEHAKAYLECKPL